jgi:hypothetical protein
VWYIVGSFLTTVSANFPSITFIASAELYRIRDIRSIISFPARDLSPALSGAVDGARARSFSGGGLVLEGVANVELALESGLGLVLQPPAP